jgi:hypothetical protein
LAFAIGTIPAIVVWKALIQNLAADQDQSRLVRLVFATRFAVIDTFRRAHRINQCSKVAKGFSAHAYVIAKPFIDDSIDTKIGVGFPI